MVVYFIWVWRILGQLEATWQHHLTSRIIRSSSWAFASSFLFVTWMHAGVHPIGRHNLQQMAAADCSFDGQCKAQKEKTKPEWTRPAKVKKRQTERRRKETLDYTTMRNGLAWRIENTQTKTASDIVTIAPRNSPKYPDAFRLILYYVYLSVV